jgi:dTDP-4-amino-4,6-dideoxygalactose transaminase
MGDWAVGPATRAIIVSHLHGGVVPMRAIMDFAAAHGLRVIEDAAQCPGAMIQGRKAGTWGDVGILSFGGSKLLSAGRGGAFLTRQADVHQRARLALNRGNVVCPLSELQAAVLLPQIDKLDARNQQRATSVAYLEKSLHRIPGLRLFRNRGEGTTPSYYKVGWQFDSALFGLTRERMVAAVRAEGIALDEGFAALHVGRSARRYRAAGSLAHADRAHRGTVVLHHPVLLGPTAALDEVALAIRKVYASRYCLAAGAE